ncbi:MAG: 4-alpha-glucanotransferase [Sphaerochaetaceae bacterium]|nr:4-alpha-glucanotransferase [Sphaerochaetaceae bacterium]MDD3942775.1 4-alpha-glucanotransferase [Sphaerochaetaceae bacterium]
MNKKIRYSGVLLHPTCLPGGHGIGDMGEEAFRFVDMLADSSVGLWQILPLGPVGFGNSPYAVRSAFAGNEMLINLDLLSDEGYLSLDDVVIHPQFKEGSVDFAIVESFKLPLLIKAADNFLADATDQVRAEFAEFCETQSSWLDDYALYRAMVDHYHDSRWFCAWDKELTRRTDAAMAYWREAKRMEIGRWKALQFFFHQQWQALKHYANEKGIGIVGDIPIFVAHDSSDAWSNRKYLKIDENGLSEASSGVPPDAYSATGQLWGNPVYDWEALEADGFSWWIRRLEHQFAQTDLVRIDHFRGFDAYWEVPAGHATAEHGIWVEAPGKRLFETLRNRFGSLPVIAEDLGVITPEVEQLRDSNGFPGMKIAHFAFDVIGPGQLDPNNMYLPHNYPELCVAYTGTHDNDTTRGWYDHLDGTKQDIVRRYLSCSDDGVTWHLMRSIMASCAQYAIVPMQDVLQLGHLARMNLPGTCGEPNWCWRMKDADVGEKSIASLRALVLPFGRTATLKDLALGT